MSKSGSRVGQKLAIRAGLPFVLVACALILTGCPHNEYVVLLEPQGDGIERTLDFYCADGTDTNTGAPNYKSFAPTELAVITALYPAGTVTNNGMRYTARNQFTNMLPGDVGGSGAYLRYATSLGEACIYSERFRGNDNFANMIEGRFQAVDRLADLMIGWSQTELGQEQGYEQLRHFLDADFRIDLRNLSIYWWEGQIATLVKTNANEEFVMRFSHYLWERGYFKVEDIPNLIRAANGDDSKLLLGRLQRFVATKMGIPETNPIPASLAFLGDENTMNKSFDKYLSGTEFYRGKLKQWEADKKENPNAQKPEPSTVASDALTALVEFDLFGNPDHLTVRLSLAAPPLHSNGRWDDTLKQVVWETDIEEKTNSARVPFACYASWVQTDARFQEKHFGKTALTGEQLTQYCLWRKSLDAQQGLEWDKFISGLQPGVELLTKLNEFRFLGEPESPATNSEQNVASPSVYPRELLKAALQ
jgi:hypothetical protein